LSEMVRYVISISITKDEVNVHVSRNGRFFDEVSFHPSDAEGFTAYMYELAWKIIMRGGD